MSTELATTRTERSERVQPNDLEMLERTGKLLAASGYFTKGDTALQVAQMAVKIMAGRELGMGPFASAQGIHIIDGKPSISANLMATAVRASRRYDYRVRKLSDSECELEFFDVSSGTRESLGLSRYDTADASKAGLMQKDNWKRHTRNMLFARAMSNGVRWMCPDVFGGNAVYVPEELGAEVDMEGDVIEMEAAGCKLLAAGPEQPTANSQQPAAYSTPYAAIATEATGKLKEFMDWCYDLHRQNGPCSDEQYRYLAGVLNAITGVNASHNAILAALVRRPVSSEDVPGSHLVGKLLDTLVEHKTVDDVKIANPTHKRGYANTIKRIYELTREIDGQARLLDEAAPVEALAAGC